MGFLKKPARRDLVDGWALHQVCPSWEEADRTRVAIAFESKYTARIRYQQPNYLVEWKP